MFEMRPRFLGREPSMGESWFTTPVTPVTAPAVCSARSGPGESTEPLSVTTPSVRKPRSQTAAGAGCLANGADVVGKRPIPEHFCCGATAGAPQDETAQQSSNAAVR